MSDVAQIDFEQVRFNAEAVRNVLAGDLPSIIVAFLFWRMPEGESYWVRSFRSMSEALHDEARAKLEAYLAAYEAQGVA